MAIEFPCVHCGRRLKVPDEAAGKQAQCPICNGLSPVPAAGWEQPAAPRSQYDAGSAGGEFNPYAAPAAGAPAGSSDIYGGRRQLAAAKVSAPATALIVVAILGIICCIIGIGAFLLGAGALVMEPRGRHPPDAAEVVLNVAFGSVQSIVGLAVSVLILVGAMKMYRLESHGWAMTAAILAMIPCISPCCILGLPFGIWALVALGDPQVKSAFGRPAPSQAGF